MLNGISHEGVTYDQRKGRINYQFELINVKVEKCEASIYSKPYIEIVFVLVNKLQGVEIRRHAVIYQDVPAVRTFVEIKTINYPIGYFFNAFRYNVLDSYGIKLNDGKIRTFEFFTRTDHRNQLVEENIIPKSFDKGNILIYRDIEESRGLFILKESPCFSDQRPEVEGNLYIARDKIDVLGWGIRPEEFSLDGCMSSYNPVIGVYSGDEEEAILALKEYQKSRAAIVPERDYMIMANPWGDRHCMEHMGEEFVNRELEACKKLGVTHYQLDDGWQKGNGLIHLVNNEYLNSEYWLIDERRFPTEFNRVLDKAKECGVELALWFAPDTNKLFRNYKEQAELLFNIYRNYGIRKFKIDAVQLRNKEAESNLEKLLKNLRERSNGDISFNLDTTADARAGYFMFQEYGNVFLENRYSDWANYYPYLTLKNLWDLCRFVPSQKLQIEFLNIDRNKDKYPKEDSLSPLNYTHEYVFAVTMFANPLAWFETSALGESSLVCFRRMIEVYKEHREEILGGNIFPIGQRPNGYSWTGFQSHNNKSNSGYIIVYREHNDKVRFRFKLLFLNGKKVRFENILESGEEIVSDQFGEDFGVIISISEINSFKLYKYIIE